MADNTPQILARCVLLRDQHSPVETRKTFWGPADRNPQPETREADSGPVLEPGLVVVPLRVVQLHTTPAHHLTPTEVETAQTARHDPSESPEVCRKMGSKLGRPCFMDVGNLEHKLLGFKKLLSSSLPPSPKKDSLVPLANNHGSGKELQDQRAPSAGPCLKTGTRQIVCGSKLESQTAGFSLLAHLKLFMLGELPEL